MGLAYLFVRDELAHEKQRDHWFKYPAVLVLMFIAAHLLMGLVFIIATNLGLIPEPQPIWEHPFF